jgi:hypothetical protein
LHLLLLLDVVLQTDGNVSSTVTLIEAKRVGLLEKRGVVSSAVPLAVVQRIVLLETRHIVSSAVPLAVVQRIGLLVLCRVLCLWLWYNE